MNSTVQKLSFGLVLMLVLTSQSLLASSQDEAAARLMARGWLRVSKNAPLHDRLVSEPGAAEPIRVNGQTVGYVFALSPSGFIVTSADDTVEPVIAFSRTGHGVTASGSPLAALLRSDLPHRLASAPGGRGLLSMRPTPETAGKWAQYSEAATSQDVSLFSNDGLSGSPTDLRVAPFVETRWGQSTADGQLCYNYYTPNHYFCGCVSAAWAQIMRYHQYPVNGIGQVAHVIQVDGESQLAATRGGNGMGGPYAWSEMPLLPTSTSTPNQRSAIGSLTYDLNVAASTLINGSYGNFTPTNTYAYMPPMVITNTFGYASAFRFDPTVNRTNAINANLDAHIPVLIIIPGHAVVCDGYGFQNDTAYHHLNLGWDGQEDAWYTLDNIRAGADIFTSIQYIYANVFPDVAGEVVSGRVLTDTGLPCVNAAVTLSQGNRTMLTDSAGIYAFRGIASGSAVTLTAEVQGYTFNPMNVTLGTSQNFTNICGNCGANDFTGIKNITFKSVSGTITNNLGEGLANIKVVFSNGGGTNQTDRNGHFTHSLQTGWSGTITPLSSSGFFEPTAYAMTDLQEDTAGVDFFGTLMCFVKASATGDNSGSSWENAYTNLASALDNTPANIEIWVACGTYKPGSLRDSSFVFNPGQIAYGGFAGTEMRRELRDWRKNPTVLSGEIGTPNSADNCYSVVRGGRDRVAAGARIDGFTITGGYSDCTIDYGTSTEFARGFGGGVYVCLWDYPSTEAASFVVDHCVVSNNYADNDLGGPYDGAGGGLYHCIARNSLLLNNEAVVGSAAYECTLENCTVVNNTTILDANAVEGGALTNCIVYFNTPYNCYENVAGYTCTTDDSYLTGIGNITANPKFVNRAAADFMIAPDSPCKNAGTTCAWMAGAKDLNGNNRISGTAPDMGTYEIQAALPALAQLAITQQLPVSAQLTGTGFTVTVQTRYGWRYQLQYSTRLTAGTWHPVGGGAAIVTGDGTAQTLIDTAAPTGRRFYRVMPQ